MRKTFATIFLLLFAVSTVPTVIFYSIFQTLQDANLYRAFLLESSYDFVEEEAYTLLDDFGVPELDAMDLEAFVRQSLPRTDLEVYVNNVLDMVFSQPILGDGKPLYVTVSLEPILQHADKFFSLVSSHLHQNLPACTGEEYVISEFSCIPADLDRSDYRLRVISVFNQQILTKVPRELNFDLNVDLGLDELKGLSLLEIFDYVFQRGFHVLLLINLVFLLSIFFFVHDSLVTVFRWFNYALLVATPLWFLLILFLQLFVIPQFDYYFLTNFLILARNNLLQILVPVFIISFGFSTALFLLAKNDEE